jgi:hypothetical protein
MKGVSDIGEQQIKHTRLRTRATHYRAMAAAIQAGDEQAIAAFPKYIPRGKPVSWYLERAERDREASEKAGELADLLSDMEHQNYLDRMTIEQKCERLDSALHTVTFVLGGEHSCLKDLPKLLRGLTSSQQQRYRARMSTLFEEVMQLFDAPTSEREDGEQEEDARAFRIMTLPGYIDAQDRPWWPLIPLSVRLGHDPQAVHGWLHDDERALLWLPIDGRLRQEWYVNEAGLLRLFLASDHPASTRLQRWLTHVVVPSLQAEGQYICGAEAKDVLADLPTGRRSEA